MARPARITINAGENSWEAQLNSNLQQLYDTPIPILLHANTLANLETIRPAASYAWCMAIVDYDGGTTPGSHLAFSNGTTWKLASNWEFANRRFMRGITSADSFGDTDDVIVITGGGSFNLTLPAIADSNEGRICRVKMNGSGTVTMQTTGGDTIDGAATKVMSTQYEAFEFVSDGTSDWQIFGASGSGGGSSTFTGLSDTPASYSGDALKVVRVNAGETALEFATAAAGSFVGLSDTPANFTSAALKLLRVNAGETAVEYQDPTLLILDDTPASYSGHAGKVVKVNSGETGVEFISELAGQPGQPLKHLSRGHLAADADQTINATNTTVDLPTEMSSAGSAVTWNGTNDEFVINETGTYLIAFQLVTDDASVHNVVTFLEKDPLGVGSYASIEQSTMFQGAAVRNTNSGMVIVQLEATDLVRMRARDLSAVGIVAREGTLFNIVKLDVSIAGGGDLECFQQGLDAAETFALTSGSMATVDLQSSIINNATELYTFTAGTDVLTVNEAGLYMISYTITADETASTLTTAAKLQKDVGAGFVDIDGSQSNGGGADKFSHGNSVLIELAATDEIRLQAQDITGDGNAIAGTMLRVVRLKRGSDAIDYNTTEEWTGRLWHDGKKIYRRVLRITGSLSTGDNTLAHGVTPDDVVSCTGWCHRDDAGSQQLPINFAAASASSAIATKTDDTNVIVNVGTGYSGAGNTLSNLSVVFEYTKV